MKENEFEEIIDSLGATERSFIKEKYYVEVKNWARLIDQINIFADQFDRFGDSFRNDLNSNIEDFNALLTQIKALSIVENPAGPEHIKNRFISFKNSTYQQLLNKKSTLETATLNIADVKSLQRIVENAKRDADNFKKSFQDSLQKQARGSTKTLARHFEDRLMNLRQLEETNPRMWLSKRHFWGQRLAGAIGLLIVLYILGINREWFVGFELPVAVLKFGVLALLYSQYHFATKNYHIYADLTAYYEHMAVISKTLTDFIASAYDDPVLKENILSNASKTLFSEIKTGHSRGDNGDSPVLENIMNNWPKNPAG